MGIAGNGGIDGAPVSAPRTGLIASATTITDASPPRSDSDPQTDWRLGFAWEPENQCGADGMGVADPCSNAPKEADDSPEIRLYDPVVLYATDRCSTFNVSRDRVGRARRRLLACQSKLLAAELWDGDIAIAEGLPNAFLASDDANTVTTVPVDAIDALACLEDAIASCSCGTGMIHATPGLMTQWKAAQLVDRFGNVFRTANDTIVIADAGYSGNGPGGVPAAAGSVWAYGTDLVTVRLDAIRVIPSDDPSDIAAMTISPDPDNTLIFLAERLAAATFDGCCHVAVEVNLPICADLVPS